MQAVYRGVARRAPLPAPPDPAQASTRPPVQEPQPASREALPLLRRAGRAQHTAPAPAGAAAAGTGLGDACQDRLGDTGKVCVRK